MQDKHPGLLSRLMQGLVKSREDIRKKVDGILALGNKPSPEMLEVGRGAYHRRCRGGYQP